MMKFNLRGRIALIILLFTFPYFAFSAYAGEKEKTPRFEILFSGGASYATSRVGFSPGVGFSYYLRKNLALSLDFGVAFSIPELDFREFGIPVGEAVQHTEVRVENQYRLFSFLSAEYSFDISPQVKPFLTAGVGWCRDYAGFSVFTCGRYYPDPSWFVWYETNIGDYKHREDRFPLLLFGGGIKYYVREKDFLKVTLRGLGPGSDFTTYQLIVGWGFRF